jgi:hypothetical protein
MNNLAASGDVKKGGDIEDIPLRELTLALVEIFLDIKKNQIVY